MTVCEPERRRTRNLEAAKERKNSKKFFFSKDKEMVRVCQNFFLKTLSISNGPLNKALENVSEIGTFQGNDKRGRHFPANKTTEDVFNKVKQHIDSFPVTESHYVRRESKRKYLDCKLSISKMYYLYKEKCVSLNEKPVSITTYKRIFCENYNYSFFKPKKDQCSTCAKYEQATGEAKNELTETYNQHKQREKDANASKAFDKERATTDNTFKTITFDLQSVLQIPCSDVSPMYYKRKLCCYNLTVYEGAPPNNAFCFTWSEVHGKRGSIEIGTCLYLYFSQLPSHVKQVSLFSDTCGGQNRNQNVAALLWFIVHSTNIDIIEQKFLESGHSMMECDSMHSAIEHQKKFVPVYTMHDWLSIFKLARSKRGKKKNDPYAVKELHYSDFLDLNILSKTILRNKSHDEDGNKINWLKIKCIRFEKENPQFIQIRYDHTGSYTKINIFGKGRPPKLPKTLDKAYQTMFPISEKKYNDLVALCNDKVIPIEFHGWYKSLKNSNTIVDRNPEPSILSETDDDE